MRREERSEGVMKLNKDGGGIRGERGKQGGKKGLKG